MMTDEGATEKAGSDNAARCIRSSDIANSVVAGREAKERAGGNNYNAP